MKRLPTTFFPTVIDGSGTLYSYVNFPRFLCNTGGIFAECKTNRNERILVENVRKFTVRNSKWSSRYCSTSAFRSAKTFSKRFFFFKTWSDNKIRDMTVASMEHSIHGYHQNFRIFSTDRDLLFVDSAYKYLPAFSIFFIINSLYTHSLQPLIQTFRVLGAMQHSEVRIWSMNNKRIEKAKWQPWNSHAVIWY